MSVPDPDLPLWLELQQGNNAALDALMERHSGGIFRFIYRYVLNEEDARDLLQETFVRAILKGINSSPSTDFNLALSHRAQSLSRSRSQPFD